MNKGDELLQEALSSKEADRLIKFTQLTHDDIKLGIRLLLNKD